MCRACRAAGLEEPSAKGTRGGTAQDGAGQEDDEDYFEHDWAARERAGDRWVAISVLTVETTQFSESGDLNPPTLAARVSKGCSQLLCVSLLSHSSPSCG